MREFKGLVPGYPGDGIGHTVTKEIKAHVKAISIPKVVNGQREGWMRIKHTVKSHVTFKWNGSKWEVYQVK